MLLRRYPHHTQGIQGKEAVTKGFVYAVLEMVLGKYILQHLYISQLMEALALIEASRSGLNQEFQVSKID